MIKVRRITEDISYNRFVRALIDEMKKYPR